MKTFQDECTEWLEPFGYTLHSSNIDKSILNYRNSYPTKYGLLPNFSLPFIKCDSTNDYIPNVELTIILPKYFITMSSGKIQFKHPNIKNYIDTMQEYYKKIISIDINE